MSEETSHDQLFKVERHDDVAVIIPPPEVESMPESLIQQAARIVLSPLKDEPPGGIVIDLSNIAYFGSTFISFLLQCYMLAKRHDSVVVLAGASERIRELLHLMSLDMLWVYEPTKDAAMKTLSAGLRRPKMVGRFQERPQGAQPRFREPIFDHKDLE